MTDRYSSQMAQSAMVKGEYGIRRKYMSLAKEKDEEANGALGLGLGHLTITTV